MKKISTISFALLAMLAVSFGCTPDGNGESKPEIALSSTEAGFQVNSTYDFPPEKSSDYAAKTPLTVTVTNKGNGASGQLAVSIDGASPGSFNLSKTSIANIAAGGSDTFTVVPVQNLAEGDYQANIHVGGRDVPEISFGVRFVISPMEIVSIEIISPPTKTAYGIGEPVDLTGLVVEATDSEGETFELEDVMLYIVHDEFDPEEPYFMNPGVKTMQIAVGAAPVKNIDLSILTILERINAAAGKTETIVLYAGETYLMPEESPQYINISAADTNITLTTPEGSTRECVIRKSDVGYIVYVNGSAGNVKLTLDGYNGSGIFAEMNYQNDEVEKTLTVKLIGANTINNSAGGYSDYNYAITVERGNVDIQGPGSLTINSGYGIKAEQSGIKKVTTSSGSTFDAPIAGRIKVTNGAIINITTKWTGFLAPEMIVNSGCSVIANTTGMEREYPVNVSHLRCNGTVVATHANPEYRGIVTSMYCTAGLNVNILVTLNLTVGGGAGISLK